jgi:predicted DNA-binding antitoxin AbrB/MazE fold protein
MLVITGFFENGKFIPDNPISLPEKTRAIIKVEETEDVLPVIPDEAWDEFFEELEKIEGEELPDDFAERFKMTNFRTPEELGL